MSWHADPATLAQYARGTADEARASSVEAHLLACERCREALAAEADARRLDDVWDRVIDEVDQPRRTVLERVLTFGGVPEHWARLLAVTPSLRASWILAMAASLAFALVGPRILFGGVLFGGTNLFLVVAPLVPVAGVAAAYGRGMDPTYEIGLASPIGGFRLLLIRSAAVLATSAMVAAVVALGLPELDWTATAWLLPSLALTLLTLALVTAVSPAVAVWAVSVLWVVGVTVVERLSTQPLASFGPGAQLVFVVVAVAAAMAVVARREAFELRRSV